MTIKPHQLRPVFGGTNSQGQSAPGACTIVARNYLSHARVLAESYLQHEPNGRFYLLVVDGLPSGVEAGPGIHVIEPKELELSTYRSMCFKYDVTELCTAVKPRLLSVLLDKYQEEQIIYFDPDILITRPLDELKTALDSSNIVLIPHLLQPIPLDGKKPSEQDILIAGAYNLGFIALRRSDEAQELLRWWDERLADQCRVDPCHGLFVDQKWIDLVPSLFAGTAILRDDTYNVAYWNLHSRTVERSGRTFLINGRPLAFFHFSGFNPSKPTFLSKHQDRVNVVKGSALADLLAVYADLHWAHGHATTSKWEYGHSRFGNGVAVTSFVRQLYLSLDDAERARFGDPFAVSAPESFYQWAVTPRGAELSPFLMSLYQARTDVAAAFPDVNGVHRLAYLTWARDQGSVEMGYEPNMVQFDEVPALVGATVIRASETVSSAADVLAAPVLSAVDLGLMESSINGNGAHPSVASLALAVENVAPTRSHTGVNVCGYLRNENGLGAVARGYVGALRTLGTSVALKDFSELSPCRADDTSLDIADAEYPHTVNLICANADQHYVIESHLGEAFFRDRYNIGVWFWELTRFPEEWHDRFAHYDEIWAATSFIANTLAPVSPIPVVRVPPVLAKNATGSREAGRARRGLSADELLFLFVFDFRSYFQRKNPLAVIDAFKRAFGGGDAARLVVKCVNEEVDPASFQEMLTQAQGYPVQILSGYWSAEEMRDLMAACDCYVSLHRAEGLGLTIADAMALGKPVIATAWSGNMDFMSEANSFPVRYELVPLHEDAGPYRAGDSWANPSVEHAAELMRQVYDCPEEAAVRGQQAQRDIAAHFSEEKVAEAIQQRLTALADAAVTYEERTVAKSEIAPPVQTVTGELLRLRSMDKRLVVLEQSIASLEAGLAGSVAALGALRDAQSRAHIHGDVEERIDEGVRVAEAHAQSARDVAGAAIEQVRKLTQRLSETQQRLDVALGATSLSETEVGRLAEALAQQRREADAFRETVEANQREQGARLADLTTVLEAQSAELATAVEAQGADLAHCIFETSALVERRFGDMARLAAAQGTQLQELTDLVEAQQARIVSLEGQLLAHGEALEFLQSSMANLTARLRARPYMAQDIYGTMGDLRNPMGYALDAAKTDLARGPQQFSDIFRGPVDLIRERQHVYLPFFEGAQAAVDLGCGRGELLKLLKERGIAAIGIEVDAGLVQQAKREGLEVIQGDAVEYLDTAPDASLDVVFSAQVIEHLDAQQLQTLVVLAAQKLRSGGLFIAETVNPECHEALKTFYVDLSHQRPIFPQVLLNLCQVAGFPTARIFYPNHGGFTQEPFDTAGEYAVVAVR